MKIKIPIKPRHIKRGVCSEPSQCAVALALKDFGFCNVYVDSTIIEINAYNDYEVNVISIKPDKKLKQFIRDFDEIEEDSEIRHRLVTEVRENSLSFVGKLSRSKLKKTVSRGNYERLTADK